MLPRCKNVFFTNKAILVCFIMSILHVYQHHVALIFNLEPFKKIRLGEIRLMVRKKL